MNKNDLDLEHLDKTTVSKLLCVSQKSVDNYLNDKLNPIPFTVVNNIKEYNWDTVLTWWIARKIKLTEKFSTFTPKDLIEAAKLEGQNLKNELDQIEIDTKKGNLLEVSDVENTWANALVDIKQSLRNVGHIAATDIIDGMTYNKKKKIIDTLIFQNLTNVIDKVEAESEHEEG